MHCMSHVELRKVTRGILVHYIPPLKLVTSVTNTRFDVQYVKLYANDVNMYFELHPKINFTASQSCQGCVSCEYRTTLYIILLFVNNTRIADGLGLQLKSKSNGKPKIKAPKPSQADLGIAWKRPKHGLVNGKWRRLDTNLVGVLYSARSVARRKQTTGPIQKARCQLEIARAEKYKPPR